MSVIELRCVSKRFGSTQVLDELSLTVPAGSLTAVLGASGSGKTTLLRLIAGFEQLDAGTVSIGGKLLDDGRRMVRAQDRGVGFVPQDGALFPHMSVLSNIAFGLARSERSRAHDLIELVGLSGLARRYPHQLSGGQQQRVALARALAIQPSVVLLDEPFSSLDATLRTALGRDVARILRETSSTAILVTHDQDEALALSDQVAVLDRGRVLASSNPRSLYREPPDALAAASIGEANLLRARIAVGQAHCVLGVVALDSGAGSADGPSRLLLRPEQLELVSEDSIRLGGAGLTRAQVVEFHYYGHDALVRLRTEHPDQELLLARVPGDTELSVGELVGVRVRGHGRTWPVEDPSLSDRPQA